MHLHGVDQTEHEVDDLLGLPLPEAEERVGGLAVEEHAQLDHQGAEAIIVAPLPHGGAEELAGPDEGK